MAKFRTQSWLRLEREWSFEPISVKNNWVGLRTAAVDNVGAAIVAYVARSGRSQTDTVICNWKGLKMQQIVFKSAPFSASLEA